MTERERGDIRYLLKRELLLFLLGTLAVAPFMFAIAWLSGHEMNGPACLVGGLAWVVVDLLKAWFPLRWPWDPGAG